MNFGKTIRLFLIEGDPNGRWACELSNWNGKAYKIPRTKVKECDDRGDLNNTGIYLLLGKDEENNELIYLGEAENILKRLSQHLIQKDFWNEVIVFVSKDNNLNKAHAKYLEFRLHEIAAKCGRYVIQNGNTPTPSTISESDTAEMEEFIQNLRLLTNTLGHKVFEDKVESIFQTASNQIKKFYLKAARGADAIGMPTSDGFVVLKNSKATLDTVNSITPSFLKKRDQLISKGVLSRLESFYVFSEDYIFSSPSLAAVMVMGRNANGLTEWKSEEGLTLKDYESI